MFIFLSCFIILFVLFIFFMKRNLLIYLMILLCSHKWVSHSMGVLRRGKGKVFKKKISEYIYQMKITLFWEKSKLQWSLALFFWTGHLLCRGNSNHFSKEYENDCQNNETNRTKLFYNSVHTLLLSVWSSVCGCSWHNSKLLKRSFGFL